jgi:hypothetical protein
MTTVYNMSLAAYRLTEDYPSYVDYCIENAERHPRTHFAECHYFHDKSLPTLCVVIHRDPAMRTAILTESEGLDLAAQLRQAARDRR